MLILAYIAVAQTEEWAKDTEGKWNKLNSMPNLERICILSSEIELLKEATMVVVESSVPSTLVYMKSGKVWRVLCVYDDLFKLWKSSFTSSKDAIRDLEPTLQQVVG